ncbi:MAG: hypothetical protein ACLQNE_14710 [Thermoguttaceae bacterium]
MRRNEKARTLILVAGSTALAATFASAVSIWANPSTVPNNNTKLCYNPTDGVANCGNLKDMGTCQTSIYYDIKNFPDGYKPGGTNSQTKQQQDDCWRSAMCVWNRSSGSGNCQSPADGDYSNWTAAAETITDPNGEGG